MISKDIILTLAKIIKVQDELDGIDCEKISFKDKTYYLFLSLPKSIYLIQREEEAEINQLNLELHDYIREKVMKNGETSLKLLIYNQKLKVITYTIEETDPKIDNL